MQEVKVCSRCKEAKPFVAFSKGSAKHGLQRSALAYMESANVK